MEQLTDRLSIAAIGVVTYQIPYSIYAWLTQKDTFTDFAGSSAFAAGAWLVLWQSEAFHPRHLVLASSITLWALRLGVFLLRRTIKHGKEPRMDGIRDDPGMFTFFWVLQSLWGWLGVLPLALACSSAALAAPGATQAAYTWQEWTDTVGITCWIAGMLIETVADEQRFQYTLTRTEPTSLCRRGIWRWSRHPNYFGDIMLWFGHSLGCLPLLWPVMHQRATVTVVGLSLGVAMPPIFTALILIGLSGMPLGERYHARRMNRLGAWSIYEEYLASTSPLVPLPPFIYRNLPMFVKRYALLALPRFEHRPRNSKQEQNGDNVSTTASDDEKALKQE
ncbi:hypothetical protein BDF22DRAFT_694951 [Syncephalis plumigaleata]|nr:hypothetical protein BDF22DRAFT_694951 [Syncephalis plumigaleata]